MADRLTVQCPTCAQPAEYSARNPWRPFCSDRCRGIDLGAWASERFRLASRPEPDDAEDVVPPPAQAIPTTRGG